MPRKVQTKTSNRKSKPKRPKSLRQAIAETRPALKLPKVKQTKQQLVDSLHKAAVERAVSELRPGIQELLPPANTPLPEIELAQLTADVDATPQSPPAVKLSPATPTTLPDKRIIPSHTHVDPEALKRAEKLLGQRVSSDKFTTTGYGVDIRGTWRGLVVSVDPRPHRGGVDAVWLGVRPDPVFLETYPHNDSLIYCLIENARRV